MRALLLAALLLPARALAACGPPRYDFLGTVTFLEDDEATCAAFRAFENDLRRGMLFARQLRVEHLPVRATRFSLMTREPRYNPDPDARSLEIGGLPPRRSAPKAVSAISLHEVGHAVLYGYLFNRSGASDYGDFYLGEAWPGLREMGPESELFADLFAQLVLNDDQALWRELEDHLHWQQNRFFSPDYVDPWTAADIRRNRELRRLRGPASRVCPITDPDEHEWYDTTRRTAWETLWRGRCGQNPEAIPHLLRVVADAAAARVDRVAASRRPGASQPLELGEDGADALLNAALLQAFETCPPTPPTSRRSRQP